MEPVGSSRRRAVVIRLTATDALTQPLATPTGTSWDIGHATHRKQNSAAEPPQNDRESLARVTYLAPVECGEEYGNLGKEVGLGQNVPRGHQQAQMRDGVVGRVDMLLLCQWISL